MNKWVVNIKDDRKHKSFEIGLVRESYSHGFLSYGWFGKDKILVSRSGATDWIPTDYIFDELVILAHKACHKMNKEEENQVKPEFEKLFTHLSCEMIKSQHKDDLPNDIHRCGDDAVYKDDNGNIYCEEHAYELFEKLKEEYYK